MGEVIAIAAAVATGVIGLVQYRMKSRYDLELLKEQSAGEEIKRQIKALIDELDETKKEANELRIRLIIFEAKNTRLRREIDALAMMLSGVATRKDVTAFVKCDKAGIIAEWSSGATIMFGWTEEEAVGRDLMIIIPPKFRQVHHNAFFTLVNSDRQPRNGSLYAMAVNKIGKMIYISITISRWKEGSQEWFSGEVIEVPKEEYLKSIEVKL